MAGISITELLQPNLLKTATALLMRALKNGGVVTIKVENHRAMFAVSDSPVQDEDIDEDQIRSLWGMETFQNFAAELVSVVQAGYGEVRFSLGITKVISYYPEKRGG